VAVPVVAVIAVGAVFAVKPGARAGLMSALVLAVVAAAALIVGGSTATDARPFLGRGIPCLRTELAIAVIPSAAAIAVLSRFAYNPLRILVGALSGGATGLVVLHLHCPIGTAAHVGVFHVLPWMAAAGIAVLIRSRVASRSFAP
jgi:hypothetical protein